MIIPSKLAEVLSRLGERGAVRRAGSEWRTRCPAHDDHGPSLYVAQSLDESCILLNCKAGCENEDIVAALGLGLDHLFVDDDEQVEVDADFAVVDEVPAEASIMPEPAPDATTTGSAGGPIDPAGPDLSHQVYETLLGLLPLSEAHRQDLRRRGLVDADIDLFGYKSLDKFALNQAVGQLKGRFDEATLLRVPGFRRNRGRVRFVDAEGLLVPVRDLQGRVVALKIRPDRDTGGSKYYWVSSAADGGPSPGSPPHVPLGMHARVDTIRLTEGEIKADVSWKLSGVPTVGVSGVSNWKHGLPLLAEMGVKVVLLAFDADARTKPKVARELAACADDLIRAGLEVRLERWDLADGKGIDDLLAAGKRPEVVSGQQVLATLARLTESTAESGAADEDDWVPADQASSVAPFPTDCLPEPVANFVIEVAEAIQCPVDFPAMGALTVASAAIGRSRKLRIRRGYEEGTQLYAAIVARPGDGKSPALRAACGPVYAHQHQKREQYRKDKAEYEQAIDAYEVARRKLLRDDDGPSPDLPERPVKPAMGQVFVGDITTEALATILDQNPRGVVLIRDELTGWVLAHNQYRGGKGADRQFFLSCWSGEPAKVDRKSDKGEPLIVVDPVLSVIGCIPPGKLAELDAGNDGEDGFIHRLLFSFPDPVPQRRWSWHGIAPKTQARWHEDVERLYGLEMGRDEFRQPTAIVIDLAPEAMPLEAWYNRHAEEMEAANFPEVLIGPWSKLIAYAARLALIVHLLRKACGEEMGADVDPESLRRALRLVAYFQSHARAVYARLRQSGQAKEVRQAIAWIRAHKGECNPSDLARNNVAGIEKTSEAEMLMKELEDRGYGRREKRKARNNRQVTWFVAKPVESGRIGSSRVGNPTGPVATTCDLPGS